MKKIIPKKLNKSKIKKYEILFQSSFACDFWNLVNIKRTIEELIAYIKYLENKEEEVKKD